MFQSMGARTTRGPEFEPSLCHLRRAPGGGRVVFSLCNCIPAVLSISQMTEGLVLPIARHRFDRIVCPRKAQLNIRSAAFHA